MTLKEPLFDPTFTTLQRDTPSPQTTGTLIGGSATNYIVDLEGRRINASSPGSREIVSGRPVTVVDADGSLWAIDASAGYPSRIRRSLGDFGSHPASQALLIWMSGNPRYYTYHSGVCLGIATANSIRAEFDGRQQIVATEYAGESISSAGFQAGDRILVYNKGTVADPIWVAIGGATLIEWAQETASVLAGESVVIALEASEALSEAATISLSNSGTYADGLYSLTPSSPLQMSAGSTSQNITVSTFRPVTTQETIVLTIDSASPFTIGDKKTITITLTKALDMHLFVYTSIVREYYEATTGFYAGTTEWYAGYFSGDQAGGYSYFFYETVLDPAYVWGAFVPSEDFYDISSDSIDPAEVLYWRRESTGDKGALYGGDPPLTVFTPITKDEMFSISPNPFP